jgi:methylisocitrate lyase
MAIDNFSPGKQLRNAASTGTLKVPGAPNALVGRLIEYSGFPAAYLSGAALSAGVLALPDVGLLTLTELTQQTNYLTGAVEIPVIVDADTGFGEAVNVERTVIELESAGAAAIQLEDQVLPKRCGHLSGKELVSKDEMCAKLRSAAAARSDADLVILARTDARGVNSLEDAVDRAKAYLDAGADWIFPEALENVGEFAAFVSAIDAPLVANMTEFGKSPLLNYDELAGLGYAAVLYPVTALRIAMRAIEAALAVIDMEGSQESLLDLMQDRQELYDLLGYDEYDQRDREYFGRKES